MIKDSGARREFETGAVRDIQEGKGRCDLLPLDVLYMITKDEVFNYLHHFKETGLIANLIFAIWTFVGDNQSAMYSWIMLLSKHFEEGAKKYGENNWQKGIPVHCYIDSAIRHYCKHKAGLKDENHDVAFIWNILCCIWTMKNKPELNDYTENKGDSNEQA